MNCELEYQAWISLDQLGSRPEIEERKRRIVDRTLQRIERATSGNRIAFRSVVSLSGHGAAVVETGESPGSGLKLE